MLKATTAKKFECVTTVDEALESIGANFEVQTIDLITESGAAVYSNRATVRTDTNTVLGVVGNGYVPIQNSIAFACFDALRKTAKATFEYGYLINGGQQVILQAKIGADWEARPGDVISNYITLMNSHNGSKLWKIFFTPKRLFCLNQLRAALKKSTNEIAIKHTKNSEFKMVEALKLLSCAAEYFIEFKETSQRLAQKIVDKKMIDAFLTDIFGDISSNNKKQQDKIETVERLIHTGKGNNGSTAWDVYNGLTEYADHYRYNHKENSEELNNASALLTSAAIKEQAWDFVVNTL
jgi:phage/plasmid-like protein (TIGR03299 family)